MVLLNAAVGRVLDLLLAPFRHLPPLIGLAVCSVVVAVGVVLVFRATTDQPRLSHVRRQLQAAIFEMRLFRDDAAAVVRALGEAFRLQAVYLRLTIVPLVVSLVLGVPLAAQLQAVYGYEGLEPGRAVLVVAQLREGPTPGATQVAIEVPSGVEIQTPAVWIPATREVVWRLAPEAPGAYTLHVIVEGERFSKTVDASRAVVRRSPHRPVRGTLGQLLYPVEAPLPASGPLTGIHLMYPEGRIDIVGWRLHWVVVFVTVTTCAVVIVAGVLRVRLW